MAGKIRVTERTDDHRGKWRTGNWGECEWSQKGGRIAIGSVVLLSLRPVIRKVEGEESTSSFPFQRIWEDNGAEGSLSKQPLGRHLYSWLNFEPETSIQGVPCKAQTLEGSSLPTGS